MKALAGRNDETLGGWDSAMWRAVKRPRCTEPWAFSLLSTDRRTPVTARNVLLVIHPAAFTFFPGSNGAPIRLATLGHFAKTTGLDIKKKKSKQVRLPGLHATIKKEKCTIKALPFHLGNFGLILFFFLSVTGSTQDSPALFTMACTKQSSSEWSLCLALLHPRSSGGRRRKG